MADQYTPEEINAIFEAYDDALKRNIPITKELQTQFEDATKGVKHYTYQLNQSLKQLGTSLKTTASAIKDGQTGASVFNDAVESSADVIDKFASKFGILGAVIGTVVKAGAAYVSAVNKQADSLYKSYQDISRAGAIGAGGMTEVFNNMRQFGYGIEQLGDMGALLKANSKNLALFSGTAFKGARQFAEVASGIQDSDLKRQFMNMGLSVDEINKGIAGYISLQTRLGQTQGKSTQELTAGAAAYVREMELLTRLTGQSREEMEAQFEQADSIEAFYAALTDLPEEQQKEARRVYAQLMNVDPSGQIARGFADSLSGFVGISDEASKLFMASSGESNRAMEDFKSGAITGAEYLDRVGTAVQQTIPVQKQIAKIGGRSGDVFGQLNKNVLLANKAAQGFQKNLSATEENIEANDDLTNKMTETTISQLQARDAMQGFINLGIKPATTAMASLANITAKAAGVLPGSSRGKTPEASAAAAAGSNKPFEGNQKEFYNKMYNTLLSEGKKAGLPNAEAIAHLGATQSALETGYGKSLAGGQNYFGVKGGNNKQATKEFINGQWVTVNDSFRQYGSMEESAADYIKFLQKNPRYASVLSARTPEEAIALQGQSGYATDPAYAAKLQSIYGKSKVPSALDGGLLSGPLSGYTAMLHGNEAVVPLPNGGSIPVDMPGFTEQMSQMSQKLSQIESRLGSSGPSIGPELTSVMGQQLSKLDELVGVMRNQLSVSNRILQYQQ